MLIAGENAKLLIILKPLWWRKTLAVLRLANYRRKCKAADYLQAAFSGDRTGLPITRVLAIAGLDVGAFGFTSLFFFSSGWTLRIRLLVIIFIKSFTIWLRSSGLEVFQMPCHRQYLFVRRNLMKQIFSIPFLLFIGLTVYSQKDNKAIDSFRYLRNMGIIANRQKDSVKREDIQLTGKFVEEVKLTPPCGIFAFGTVVEFEVTDVTGITYKSKNIEIVVTCPDIYGDNFFEKDKLYQVTLSQVSKSDSSWIIPNKNLLKKNRLSFDPFATAIKKIP